MNKIVNNSKALARVVTLVGADSVEGYLQLTGKEKNERLFEVANRLLDFKKGMKANEFSLLMEEDDDFLLRTDSTSIVEEQKAVFTLARDLYRLVAPLLDGHASYLTLALPDTWGECSMDNKAILHFVCQSRYTNLAFWIAYKITMFEVIGYHSSDSHILMEHLMSLCMDAKRGLMRKNPPIDGEALLAEATRLRNHVEIGRRLGFDKYAQNMYDALMDRFVDMYASKYVDLTKELSEWTYHTPHDPLPARIDFARQVVSKANELKAKYAIDDEWEDEVYEHLINELLADFYPEDDDELELIDLEEDVYSFDDEDDEALDDEEEEPECNAENDEED